MKRNLKLSMLVLVLLLAVGFAAVSTTLIINGTAKFGTNEEDFDVIFTKSVIDGVDVTDTTISEDGKSLTFTTNELAKADDKSVLDFEVTNNSTQYDANVTMVCIAEGEKNEYYTITNTIPSVISAKTTEAGSVTATLKKVSTEEITETFTCTITANAVEKTEAGVETEEPSDEESVVQVLKGTGSALGDEIAINNQEFYVLSNDGTNIRMLSKLNVDFNTNLQSEGASSTLFSNDEIMGDNYSDYSGSLVEGYVNNYVNFLNSTYGLSATGELIQTSELDNLGCVKDDNSCSTSSYSWLYSSSYWTGTANGTYKVWYVGNDGTYDNVICAENYMFGVRPVITISADLI